MAVELPRVEALLEEQGLDKATANNYINFDTEDSLKSVLASMKPVSFASMEDIDKNADLKKLVSEYGDKRTATIQSELDKLKLVKTPTEPIKKDGGEPNPMIAQMAAMEAKFATLELEKAAGLQAKDFDTLVEKAAIKHKLEDKYLINLVSATLKKDATMEEVNQAFKDNEDYRIKNGISQGGSIGGGGKATTTVSTAIDEMLKAADKKADRNKK